MKRSPWQIVCNDQRRSLISATKGDIAMLINSKIALSVALVLATASAAVAAPLNTTQIAHDLLGPAQRVYYQDLTTHANQPHLKIDKLGAGDFIFVDSGFPFSNPFHSYEDKGLLTSIERPATATGGISLSAAVGQNITIPQRFVLTATFIEPKIVSLIPNQPLLYQFAAVVPLTFGNTLAGVTSQFRDVTQQGQPLTPGQRLTVPFASIARPNINANLYNKVINAQNPSPFTLVMHVERSASDSAGEARLYVGDQLADSVSFNFCLPTVQDCLTAATVFNNIQVGIATAFGTNYRASVYVTEFEIWAPTLP
jgi:hypothetical protein